MSYQELFYRHLQLDAARPFGGGLQCLLTAITFTLLKTLNLPTPWGPSASISFSLSDFNAPLFHRMLCFH